MQGGTEGDHAQKRAKDYWRKNLATWKDAPLPDLAHVDVDLEVAPGRSWFRTEGRYELVNRTRATHDDQGSPECHTPLLWSVVWSAHGRNHSLQMRQRGSLFHADYPSGQNCAYGCDPPCEMNMYMTGSDEPHCPDLSHHCNIMRCQFSHIGIGYDGNWNTQNFF